MSNIYQQSSTAYNYVLDGEAKLAFLTENDYDLISGKVLEVRFQPGARISLRSGIRMMPATV
jgi:hypothetical protein